MVQSIDNNINRQNYNAVKINIQKPQMNGNPSVDAVQNDNNGNYSAVSINIDNPTVNFEIDSNILLSILQYNSKELTKGIISKPIQKLYYMDEEGCVTFTTGACVNSFTLAQPVKILLNDRLVKLFKLFKGEKVNFTLGYDAISDDIIQTKVRFETTDVIITAILSCDDSMLNQFPTRAVRGRAEATYPYSININREQLIQTISRLLLFSSANSAKDVIKPYAVFDFKKDSVVVYDTKKENKEEALEEESKPANLRVTVNGKTFDVTIE